MIILPSYVKPAPLAPISKNSIAAKDRSYLIDALNTVVASFKRNSADDLPLAADAKITYNGKIVNPEESLWKTFSSIRFQEIFVDTMTNYGILYGVIEEMNASGKEAALLALAVRVESGLINGIEMIVGHKPDGWEEGLDIAECFRTGRPALWRPEALIQLMPPLNTIVDPATRVSRDDLVAIAHSYWEGMELNDSSIILADPASDRYEQGVCTTRPPGMPDPAGCDKTPDKFPWIRIIRDRRYLVVDEERGIVICHVILDTPPGYYAPGATVERTPKSVLVSEFFKVFDGKIQKIICILDMQAYGAKSNWE